MQEGFKFAFYSEPKEKCLVRIKTLMEASSLTEVLKTFKKVFLKIRTDLFVYILSKKNAGRGWGYKFN